LQTVIKLIIPAFDGMPSAREAGGLTYLSATSHAKNVLSAPDLLISSLEAGRRQIIREENSLTKTLKPVFPSSIARVRVYSGWAVYFGQPSALTSASGRGLICFTAGGIAAVPLGTR
jgi:hypothetical protein